MSVCRSNNFSKSYFDYWGSLRMPTPFPLYACAVFGNSIHSSFFWPLRPGFKDSMSLSLFLSERMTGIICATTYYLKQFTMQSGRIWRSLMQGTHIHMWNHSKILGPTFKFSGNYHTDIQFTSTFKLIIIPNAHILSINWKIADRNQNQLRVLEFLGRR